MQKFQLSRRQTLAGLSAAGAMTVLGAPFSLSARAESTQVKAVLGIIRLASQAPSFIAQERGYFKAENLDMEFKYFEAAQPMAVAIAGGDVDYGVTAMSGGLINLAEKNAVKVIGGSLQEEKASQARSFSHQTKPMKPASPSLSIWQVRALALPLPVRPSISWLIRLPRPTISRCLKSLCARCKRSVLLSAP